MRIVVLMLLLAWPAHARDKQAIRLSNKAIKLANSGKELWVKLILETDTILDDELKKLVSTYEKAVDLYQKSMEIEEHPPLNGAVVLLARRLANVRHVQLLRANRKKLRKPPTKRPAPRPEPEPEPEPEPRPEPQPEPEPEPEPRSPFPEIYETKAEARRGKQGLRNFLMNHYFPSRKLTGLVTRCSVCNGTGRRKTGQLDRRRRAVTVACPSCNETGAHLNVNVARKAFWLIYSPLYRSNAENRAAFESNVKTWHEDPRKVPEFLKSVSILETEYHGLWGRLKYVEKGYVAETKRRFARTVDRILVRIGRRWFFYDEAFDKDLFTGAVD